MFIFKICPTSFIKPPITRSQVSFKKILQLRFSANCACCSTEYAAFMGNCCTSHPYKMSLSTFNLYGVNSRLLRSGTQLSTFKSTFWTIPCCHHRKFKRRQLDMYSGAGTSVRIGKCAILQSDKWEASQNITLIWWTFNDQRMQLNHLIKRNVQKQLFISITFQMQPIILPIALKTIPHTFSAHYCPRRYLNTANSTHSKLSVL